jgi:hypothetical protein
MTRVMMHDELGRTQKEMVVAYFRIVSQYLPELLKTI